MEKVRLNLYLNKEIKDEIRRQSKAVGMDMGAYFTYLVLRERDRMEKDSWFIECRNAVMELLNDD